MPGGAGLIKQIADEVRAANYNIYITTGPSAEMSVEALVAEVFKASDKVMKANAALIAKAESRP